MMKYLVDSNILIYHLKNESLATNFLLKNIHQCAISQITYIEVLSFPFEYEQEQDVRNLLESFKIIDVDREIAVQATMNRKIKKIKVPDRACRQMEVLTKIFRLSMLDIALKPRYFRRVR